MANNLNNIKTVPYSSLPIVDREAASKGTAIGVVGRNTVRIQVADLIGPQGIPGIPGESAYDIAVKHGYEGTEAEWAAILPTVEENVGNLETSVSTLTDQYTTMANRVTDIETDTAALNTTVETISGNITSLSGRVESLETNFDNIEDKFEKVASDTGAVSVEVQALKQELASIGAYGFAEWDATSEQPVKADADSKHIYLVKKDETDEYFQSWIYYDNAWKYVGDAKVNLDGYLYKPDDMVVSVDDIKDDVVGKVPNVASIKGYVDSRETVLNTAIAAKQDLLTFDDSPSESSTNPVTSRGIRLALDATLHGIDYQYYTDKKCEVILAKFERTADTAIAEGNKAKGVYLMEIYNYRGIERSAGCAQTKFQLYVKLSGYQGDNSYIAMIDGFSGYWLNHENFKLHVQYNSTTKKVTFYLTYVCASNGYTALGFYRNLMEGVTDVTATWYNNPIKTPQEIFTESMASKDTRKDGPITCQIHNTNIKLYGNIVGELNWDTGKPYINTSVSTRSLQFTNADSVYTVADGDNIEFFRTYQLFYTIDGFAYHVDVSLMKGGMTIPKVKAIGQYEKDGEFHSFSVVGELTTGTIQLADASHPNPNDGTTVAYTFTTYNVKFTVNDPAVVVSDIVGVMSTKMNFNTP